MPMSLVGFEPTVSADERPQTYALDGAAIGTGYITFNTSNIFMYALDMYVHGKEKLSCTNIFIVTTKIGGPGSVVVIATAYGLDGPGIESRWGEIFRICPDRP